MSIQSQSPEGVFQGLLTAQSTQYTKMLPAASRRRVFESCARIFSTPRGSMPDLGTRELLPTLLG